MVRETKKNGFTIAEVLVSMLIMSVFFVVMSKSITSKPKAEILENKHGYYECYRYNNRLYEHLNNDGISTGLKESTISNCKFEPPRGIAFAVVYAINVNVNGERATYRQVEYQFNKSIEIRSSTIPKFYTEQMIPEDSERLSYAMMKDYIKDIYPGSELATMMDKDDALSKLYAVFICW